MDLLCGRAEIRRQGPERAGAPSPDQYAADNPEGLAFAAHVPAGRR
jgi:hypothetical protein